MNDVVDFWAVDNLKKTVILLSVFDDKLMFENMFYWYRSKNIFEHINSSLLGLSYRTQKCRSEEIRGGAFSIRL